MVGMRASINVRPDDGRHAIVCHYDGNGALVMADERGSDHGWYRMAPSVVRDALLPDLTDPATVGCLQAVVAEAWGSTVAWSSFLDDGGRAIHSLTSIMKPKPGHVFPTVEQLVEALEKAPTAEHKANRGRRNG